MLDGGLIGMLWRFSSRAVMQKLYACLVWKLLGGWAEYDYVIGPASARF